MLNELEKIHLTEERLQRILEAINIKTNKELCLIFSISNNLEIKDWRLWNKYDKDEEQEWNILYNKIKSKTKEITQNREAKEITEEEYQKEIVPMIYETKARIEKLRELQNRLLKE